LDLYGPKEPCRESISVCARISRAAEALDVNNVDAPDVLIEYAVNDRVDVLIGAFRVGKDIERLHDIAPESMMALPPIDFARRRLI
jgi:hypothetical protein